MSPGAAHTSVRWTNIARFIVIYNVMKAYPKAAKRLLLNGAWNELQSTLTKEEFEKHFVPPYNPWDQRLCVAPAGDLFQCIRKGQASVVTGHIEAFTERGIQM